MKFVREQWLIEPGLSFFDWRGISMMSWFMNNHTSWTSDRPSPEPSEWLKHRAQKNKAKGSRTSTCPLRELSQDWNTKRLCNVKKQRRAATPTRGRGFIHALNLGQCNNIFIFDVVANAKLKLESSSHSSSSSVSVSALYAWMGVLGLTARHWNWSSHRPFVVQRWRKEKRKLSRMRWIEFPFLCFGFEHVRRTSILNLQVSILLLLFASARSSMNGRARRIGDLLHDSTIWFSEKQKSEDEEFAICWVGWNLVR